MPVVDSAGTKGLDGGRPAWRLVVHGGAGRIERERLPADEEAAIRAALDLALERGSDVLEGGGGALDAAEAAVRVLEDDPHFNAGRGSVFTHQGSVEMDASIMDGRNRGAGAVTGATGTRNPIRLARAVMENSPHVFLSREGADEFSRSQALPQEAPAYFQIDERWRQLQELRSRPPDEQFDAHLKYGTVGAVALDTDGHVAAATSTGGLTGKRWGRIGDSPIIGAGTYADDRAGAVSATGAGEYFIRVAVAHEICAQIRFEIQRKGATPDLAEVQAIADAVIAEMGELGGTGGIILVTPWGHGLTSFNSPGMYRGEASPSGRTVAIFGDESLGAAVAR